MGMKTRQNICLNGRILIVSPFLKTIALKIILIMQTHGVEASILHECAQFWSKLLIDYLIFDLPYISISCYILANVVDGGIRKENVCWKLTIYQRVAIFIH